MSRAKLATLAPILALGLGLAPGPLRAELFRCVQPDGRTIYTDNAASCPNAAKHEPKGRIQNIPTGLVGAPRPPPAAAQRETIERAARESDAAFWRQKKAHKQAELANLEQRHERLRRYVTWCNRGGELFRRDEAGLRSKVDCRSVDREFEEMSRELEALRAYLASGLEEECRRSGCLPGWIR